jgi:hypothetical protein
MTTTKTYIFIALIFLSCTHKVDRYIDIAKQVNEQNALLNFCLKKGSYWEDTLQLTRWDSLDKITFCHLIFNNNNKLTQTTPDIFLRSSIGMDSNSTWVLNDKTGLLTLDIMETGIDDRTHFKAEYKIDDLKIDVITLVKTKIIIDEYQSGNSIMK